MLSLCIASTGSRAQEAGFSPDTYFKASNTRGRDEFGQSVSISGDTAVIGAYLEDSGARDVDGNELDDSAPDAGAAYVFIRDGGRWRQQAYLKASNADRDDRFGWAVAVDGDLIVVGAPEEDGGGDGVGAPDSDNSASNAGAAYVFERRNRSWQQVAYLKPDNPDPRDRFGTAVAIDGERILVGAPRESSDATGVNGDGSNNRSLNSGAVYVFARSNRGWEQEAYLKASNTGSNDRFGAAVAIDGTDIAVGAPGEGSDAVGVGGDPDNNFAVDSGAVYVFELDDDRWGQIAYVKAFNTETGDLFGTAVDITDLELLAGAVGEDGSAPGVNGAFDDLRRDAGAAYVYLRDGLDWIPTAYLKASNPDFDDAFGSAVALDRRRIVVSAPFEDGAGTGTEGDDSNNGASDSGAAWSFFRAEEGGWREGQYLKATNADRGDRFGASLSLDGSRLLFGAPGEESRATGIDGDQNDNDLSNAGAGYLFLDAQAAPVTINPGLNDAWFNENTPGQGFFVNVFPVNGTMFVGWFTYDLFLPDEDTAAILGWAGHRWVTAQGGFEGDRASLEVFLTAGGVFNADQPAPAAPRPIGALDIIWFTCNRGALVYDLDEPRVSGQIPLRRVVRDNIALCETLSADVEAP
ncbi:MAG: hypothetical protein V2I57_08680 [Xanthomonadales bacterium]|jgi:hypothetical protein|nr:hypothetical protein [Xanthomonadales bacterium]